MSDCKAVYTYLDSQSKTMSSYASSPVWGVVDGPWKLQGFNADGNATFVPNKSYSGPVKPTLLEFKEVPFTTEAAEYNVLRSGNGSQKLSVGYLPTSDAPAKPANATVGANPVPGYTLDPLYGWAINYFVPNIDSTTPEGQVLKQLYFRQALAYLVNQEAVISGPLRGYGTATVGPVPSNPATYLSAQGKKGDPFPYDPGKAKQLLSSHGWKVVPNGTTTCTNPSLCGAGVKQGQGLSFTLPYATGINWIDSEMTQLKSNASQVGIQLSLQPKPFNQVTAIGGGGCVVTKSSCAWDFVNWGGGWAFAPDYEPTGETLFQSGSAANSSGYTNSQNDNLIQPDADQQLDDAAVQLAGLPADAASRDVAAERRLRADRDRQQPARRHPAGSDAVPHPGKLVLHQVIKIYVHGSAAAAAGLGCRVRPAPPSARQRGSR